MEEPTPRRSIRYAYDRLNEAALRRRPSEALVWARLIVVLDRIDPTVRSVLGVHTDADGMRAIRRETMHARRAGQIDELLEMLGDDEDQDGPEKGADQD